LVEDEVYQGVDPASVGFSPVAFALVYGSGGTSGEGYRAGGSRTASETVSKALEDAADDPSPRSCSVSIQGRPAFASDVVWNARKRAREGKPLIACSPTSPPRAALRRGGADAIVASPARSRPDRGARGAPVLGPLAKLETG
jgi:hypothetical protein